MSDLDTRFNQAAEKVKDAPQQSNDKLLELYALYKQANVGDVNTGGNGNDDFDL